MMMHPNLKGHTRQSVDLLRVQERRGMKRKIAVVAPTSVVARNYISHLGDRCEIVTVGRRDSDIIFDLLKDNELRLSKG